MEKRKVARVVQQLTDNQYFNQYECCVRMLPEGTYLWQLDAKEKMITVWAEDEFDAMTKAEEAYETSSSPEW